MFTLPVGSGRLGLGALLLVASMLALGESHAQAQTAPSTVVAATLGQGRLDHTMTTLADGRVLIAGGTTVRGGAPLSSAEIFDPATQQFSSTGNMTAARVFHSAVRLADGKVLILGGQGTGGVSLASAEVYDPATGAFRAVGAMAVARNGISSTATLLNDGSVLVFGAGLAELYDPGAQAFVATGAPVAARQTHAAALLADGRVLLTGGTIDGPDGATSSEVYDPATGTFSEAGTMASPRLGHASVTLPDGRVLIVGGIRTLGETTGDRRVATAEVYNPATGGFTLTGAPQVLRTLARALTLNDGSVLIYRDGLDVEIYDPISSSFRSAGTFVEARNALAAAVLNDGRVLVTGGWLSPPGQPTPPADQRVGVASAELFTAPPRPAGPGFSSSLSRDGFSLVIFGGTIAQLREAMAAEGCDAPIFATVTVNGRGEFVGYFPTSALDAPNVAFLARFPGEFIPEGTPLLGGRCG